MMEFVEMVIRRKSPEIRFKVHLVTGPDEGNVSRQRELLDSITKPVQARVSSSAGHSTHPEPRMRATSSPIRAGRSCLIADSIFFSLR